VKVQLTLRNN